MQSLTLQQYTAIERIARPSSTPTPMACIVAPLGTFEGKVPEAAMQLVKERQAQIMSGEFVVEINDEEPKSS